jgi:subtilisin family serine protease
VLPGADVIAYRVARSLITTDAAPTLAALERALRDHAAVVLVNNVAFFSVREQRKAVQKLHSAGVIVVASAGSEVLPLRHSVSPVATSPHAIGVAASDVEGNPWRKGAGYSTHADRRIAIAAPGGDIWDTGTLREQNETGESYIYRWSDGTTFSAAYVSAAAALWLEYHGERLDLLYREPWQKVEAFRYCLTRSARHFRNPLPKRQQGRYGAGVLDVPALLVRRLPEANVLTKPGAP